MTTPAARSGGTLTLRGRTFFIQYLRDVAGVPAYILTSAHGTPYLGIAGAGGRYSIVGGRRVYRPLRIDGNAVHFRVGPDGRFYESA